MDNLTTRLAVPFELDAPHRRVVVGEEPMILHCHHYNTFLQQTIQDAEYVDSRPFLVGAANEVAFCQLSRLFQDEQISDVDERKRLAELVFKWAGFGLVDMSGLDERGGTLETPHSHYSHAWRTKLGTSRAPVDFFTTGWLSGALAAVYGTPQGGVSARQVACMAAGSSTNRFELEVSGEPNYAVFESPGLGALTEHRVRPVPDSPVDYEGILTALTSMPIEGDDTGSIPAFGVYLTRHYANYYNRISFEFIRDLGRQFGDEGVSIAQPLLVESGHVCAFNTFGGIMTSPEWDALIKPQLATQEDWVHGITAAVNALGWGRWQVTELSSREATFAIHDDYESVGYQAAYGSSDHPVAYLAQGAAAGIMNLVYHGDVEQRPEFSPSFYRELFRSDDSFQTEPLESRAGGDELTSFRVYRP